MAHCWSLAFIVAALSAYWLSSCCHYHAIRSATLPPLLYTLFFAVFGYCYAAIFTPPTPPSVRHWFFTPHAVAIVAEDTIMPRHLFETRRAIGLRHTPISRHGYCRHVTCHCWLRCFIHTLLFSTPVIATRHAIITPPNIITDHPRRSLYIGLSYVCHAIRVVTLSLMPLRATGLLLVGCCWLANVATMPSVWR